MAVTTSQSMIAVGAGFVGGVTTAYLTADRFGFDPKAAAVAAIVSTLTSALFQIVSQWCINTFVPEDDKPQTSSQQEQRVYIKEFLNGCCNVAALIVRVNAVLWIVLRMSGASWSVPQAFFAGGVYYVTSFGIVSPLMMFAFSKYNEKQAYVPETQLD